LDFFGMLQKSREIHEKTHICYVENVSERHTLGVLHELSESPRSDDVSSLRISSTGEKIFEKLESGFVIELAKQIPGLSDDSNPRFSVFCLLECMLPFFVGIDLRDAPVGRMSHDPLLVGFCYVIPYTLFYTRSILIP
jgi:hypothetical protein